MNRDSLAPGYELHWYVIKDVLGRGGFGITYLAEDTHLNQLVAIKEFLPVEMAVRESDSSIHPLSEEYQEQFQWGLERFMSEAQTLAQFKHPNIVRVFTVFPENNTAYMVMEYENGEGLQEILKQKKTLPEKQLKEIVLPILDGLMQVHTMEFIHRDIKPANIFIREDGSPVLLDFGSARHALGQKTKTLTSLVSPGFAPFEQYVSKGDKQGPWTDIYALGATLYRAALGRSPAEAMDRSEALLHTNRDSFVGAAEIKPEGYSTSFLLAIDHALAFKAEDRPSTIESWRRELTSDELTEDDIPTVDASNTAETIKLMMDTDQFSGKLEHESPASSWISFNRMGVLFLLSFIVILLIFAFKSPSKRQIENSLNETEPLISLSEPLLEEIDLNQDEVGILANQARADIAALRLSSPDGNNALEKYHQIMELYPDSPVAKDIYNEVTDKYIELSLHALKEDDPNLARAYLDKAQELNAAHPGIDVVKNILDKAKALKNDNDAVLSSADRRQLESIKKRLQKNPDDKNAIRRLRNLVSNYETKVKTAIAEKDYERAQVYIEEMLEIVPNNKRLQETLDKINKMKKSKE